LAIPLFPTACAGFEPFTNPGAICPGTQPNETTPALALKNSPLVGQVSRELVRSEAARLGYQVDANVSKLMSYLRRRRQARALCNLGWINCEVREDAWRALPWNRDIFTGAQTRAAELGYALEEIWVRSPDFKLSRLPQLLAALGIEGLLLPPPVWELPLNDHIPWAEVHAVIIHEPRDLPGLHRVDFDETHNLQLALAEVAKLGYRRPGLVISRYTDSRSNFALSGQFLADQGDFLPRERIIPFWTEGWQSGPWSPDEFLDWFRRERPDVLMVAGNEWRANLAQRGLSVPRDVGLVHLHWGPDVAKWSGVDLQRELAGSAAIDLLTSHLVRGEKGLPSFVKQVQIRGRWHAGETLRDLSCVPLPKHRRRF